MKSNEFLDNLIIGRVDPHIYAFTTETIPNYLKVGDTYRPVYERINEWKQKFPNLKREEDWEWSAKIDNNENPSYFRDFAVHQFLEQDKNKSRLKKEDIDSGTYYSSEFFKNTSINDVNEAIEDISNSYAKNDFKYNFYKYASDTRLKQEEHYRRSDIEWEPRNNQQEVIDNFVEAVNKGRTNLLMYAVMRFGKSFTSLMCAKAKTKVCPKGSKFVVVVSGKADVKDEWKQNVELPKNFESFVFIDSDSLKSNKKIIEKNLSDNKTVVCFLTLQDLQGDNIKWKHKELFLLSNRIDLLIIDETHFGARANKYGLVLLDRQEDIQQKFDKGFTGKEDDGDFVDEDEAMNIVKSLNAKIRLHLSGTPYRILMGSEFENDDIISFIQFNDILNEKQKWNEENINKNEIDNNASDRSPSGVNEWDNPYYGFPQMVRFACNLNKSAREKLEELTKKGIKFQLSELLKPQSIKKDEKGNKHKKFVFEDEIRDMLLVIDGSKEDGQLFSFLNYEKIKKGNMCRHIVMVLPYCASCDAMENLINKMSSKKLFKNLDEYEVINISGVEIKKEYRKISGIKQKIELCESSNKKTITLTVNRMLTGVTVKQWDTMIYLKDTSSPQEYDQAIFRLQNQYIKKLHDKSGNEIKLDMKPQTLLVDYYPSRMFRMQENKSFIYNINIDEGGNRNIYKKIEEDLKISPIIRFSEKGIVRVEPNDIMEEVSNYSKNRGVAEEVDEIPIDLNLINDSTIYEAIIKENEIGSKEGLSINSYKGEEYDGEGNTVNVPNDSKDKKLQDKSPNIDAIDDDEKESIRKRFKTLYSRILFYSYLSKIELNSLEDILTSIRNNSDNKRIFKNLGLDHNVLVQIVMLINKSALRKLDYKIENLNKLSREQEMGLQGAHVAVKKFGRLGLSEIVTPENVVDSMVSLINVKEYAEILGRNEKILDIASKMGEFAIGLVKIFDNKKIDKKLYYDAIYSIPTSKIAYEFTRKIYEILGLNIDCIAEQFTSYDLLDIRKIDEQGNNTKELDYCLIKNVLSQDVNFNFIELNDDIEEEENQVKFGVVVGNPPYQRADGGAQASAEPIYHEFVRLGKKITNRFLTIIMPSRWYAGGKGLDEFRREMLNDNHIVIIDDYLHPEEVFPNTNNRGGLCDFLWDVNKDNKNIIEMITHRGNKEVIKNKRELKVKGFDIFVRDTLGLSIIEKVMKKYDNTTMDNHISSRKPFGIESNIIKSRKWKDVNDSGNTLDSHVSALRPFGLRGYFTKDANYKKNNNKNNTLIKCYGKGKLIGYVDKKYINDSDNSIKKYKVFIPRANNIATELNDDNLNAFVGKPNEICTESYLVVGSSLNLNKNSAENLVKYMKTKFMRYMHGLAKISQDATAKTFRFTPLQDFSDKSDIDWNQSVDKIDKQLYKKYKLSKNEIDFIEESIKPMK